MVSTYLWRHARQGAYWASPNIELWELFGKAAARLPHSKSRLCKIRRDLVVHLEHRS